MEASERSGEASKIGAEKAAQPDTPPDPEVPAKATRRRFSAKYKLKILRQADQCGPGEVGALLRREGLYWSNLQTWRRQGWIELERRHVIIRDADGLRDVVEGDPEI